ncbi:hypothetical protein BDV06DRAFT_19261 [Aspergillus oleicola]
MTSALVLVANGFYGVLLESIFWNWSSPPCLLNRPVTRCVFPPYYLFPSRWPHALLCGLLRAPVAGMRRITFPPWALIFCAHPPQPPKKNPSTKIEYACDAGSLMDIPRLKCVLVKQVVWGAVLVKLDLDAMQWTLQLLVPRLPILNTWSKLRHNPRQIHTVRIRGRQLSPSCRRLFIPSSQLRVDGSPWSLGDEGTRYDLRGRCQAASSDVGCGLSNLSHP